MTKPVEDLPLEQKIASGRSHIVDVAALPWKPSPFPGIDMKVLMNDPSSGMSTMLVRMAPGATVPLHEHAGIEQAYVIEGSIKDHDGEVTAGNYTWRDAGNKHVNVSPNGAIVLGFFTKPNIFYGGHTHMADFKKDSDKA